MSDADAAAAGAGPEPGAEPAPGEELEQLRRELAALQDRHLRLQAEFENYRKRQQREREEMHRQAKERILREIPGIVDNLERAARHAPDAPAATVLGGIALVLKELLDLLARFGVEPIAAQGTPFDPHRHEAMASVDTAGDPPDGTVVEEYRRGYLLDGKVLRPALVAVARLAGEDGEPGE